MKRINILMLTALMACVLSGCDNYAKDYDKNTLVVKKNNSLVEISIEDFKGTNITAEGLEGYIDEQVEAYNEEHEGNLVKKTTMDTEDMSKAKLVLTYKDIECYNGFNSLECILDDLFEVDESRLKGNYTSVDGDESLAYDKLEDIEDAKVLVLSENTDVVIKGKILYYNSEVTLNDGIATCSGEKDAVIIFE